MKHLIENIIAIRSQRGYSQEVIANAIGCTISNWSKVEQGKQNVQLDDLEKISNCLGLRVIDLFTWPEIYVRSGENCDDRCSITIDIPVSKRDLILQMLSGK